MNFTKHLALLLLLILIASFQNDEKGINQDLIIGEWGIYTSGKTTMAYCNSCPLILFNDSASLTLKLPNSQSENYKWSIKENILSLKIDSSNINPYFDKGEYFISIYNSELDILKIKMTNKDNYSYFLSKH